MPLLGVVVERADVVFRVTARYPRAVVLQAYGGTLLSEVRAVGEEAVAVALARDIAHGEVQLRQVRAVHRADGKAYRTQQPSLCHGKGAAGHGNAVRLCRGEILTDGSAGRILFLICIGPFRLIVRNCLSDSFLRRAIAGYKIFLLLRRRIAAFYSRQSGRCVGGVSHYAGACVFLPGHGVRCRAGIHENPSQTRRRQYDGSNGYDI